MKATETSPSAHVKKSQPEEFDLVILGGGTGSTIAAWTFAGEGERVAVVDRKYTVPVLVMHGDDDQIVPYADSAPLSAKLLRNSVLKTYRGFPHGMPTTEAVTINADLLTFLKKSKQVAA
jgi:pimeloyl-ACP methyl ester carboxylesterase